MKLKNFLRLAILAFGLVPVISHAAPLDGVSFMKGCWGTIDEDGNKRTEDWLAGAENDELGIVQTRDQNNNMVGDHGFQEIRFDQTKNQILLIASFIGH